MNTQNKTKRLTIGMDLFVRLPAWRAPAFLTLRFASGHAAHDHLCAPRFVGDRRHTVCVLNDRGDIVAEEVITNTREVLAAFSQRFPSATVVMETGTHSPWVSRLFEARGHHVLVANARKVRAISQSTTKSDLEDARMLARLGRADPALLSPITHRSEAGQRALVRLKVRDALVRNRVNAMNRVRFLVKSLGVPVPSSVKATAFVRKLFVSLPAFGHPLTSPLAYAQGYAFSALPCCVREQADAATVALVEPCCKSSSRGGFQM